MAKSVDPDQTSHSDAYLIWVYAVCKDLSVPILRVINCYYSTQIIMI